MITRKGALCLEKYHNFFDFYMHFNICAFLGLGTSTSKEAKEYFSDMVRHKIKFNTFGSWKYEL